MLIGLMLIVLSAIQQSPLWLVQRNVEAYASDTTRTVQSGACVG